MRVVYNHEYERRLKACFIGCGGHAFRNVYPTFQYAPVDLAAVCDLDRDRAERIGRQFGARAFYTDHREMLDKERPEVVFVVTNYDEFGQPRYPVLACDIMQAGAHAWIEKPPASAPEQVVEMMRVSRETGKFTGVGFKKMFFPANVKAKEIISAPDYGQVFAITARYPERVPPMEDRSDPHKMLWFLDHIMHPHSLLRLLGGPLQSLYVERHAAGTAAVALRFQSGVVGSLCLSHGQSPLYHFERTEVFGEGGTVVVENNLRVHHYLIGGAEGGYGRAGSPYDTGDASARYWEPEFSLGQIYNKNLFLLGYAPEIIDFCQCALENRPPQKGSLADALEMTQIYQAYCRADGEVAEIGGQD